MTAFSNSIYCVLGPIIDGSICRGWKKDKLYRGNGALRVAAVAFWRCFMVNEGPPLRVAGGVGARSACVVSWLRGCRRIPLFVGMIGRRWSWVTRPCPWLLPVCVVCLPVVDGRILPCAVWWRCHCVCVGLRRDSLCCCSFLWVTVPVS
ncbi:hypothetical protein TcG_08766 [Trypanosoma cruzi]|nr:hypothetical protein TcG_08766 [Trypanosoma cruzi]